MTDRVEVAARAVKSVTNGSIKDARQVVGTLIARGIVQWPTEPRIISNLPELYELPTGAIISNADGVACQRIDKVQDTEGHRAWAVAGEESPQPSSMIPLPAEVLA